MAFKSLMLAAIAALFATFGLALTAQAGEGIEIHDPYALPTLAGQTSGAAFMIIHNHGTTADRLIDVRSDVADLTQLHTHIMDGNGVMKMVQVKEGFDMPADSELMLERGGNHIMMMGLHAPLIEGEEITVTLVFEHAGDVVVTIPVAAGSMEDIMHSDGHGAADGTGMAMPSN